MVADKRLVGVGRPGRTFEHAGEIHMTYRGQRRFPPTLGAESADPSILVRQERGLKAGCAHGFDHNRWGVGSL
jgi:hypothetical protein